jgi:outer membrane immunogenic protein
LLESRADPVDYFNVIRPVLGHAGGGYRMKRLCLGLLGLTLTGAVALSANAADIYTPGLKDGPYVPNWGGAFVGLHAGGIWGTQDVVDLDRLNPPPGTSFSISSTDLISGGQMGYNWQRGQFVLGIELDLGYQGLNGHKIEPAALAGQTFSGLNSGFYADIVGRLGYAFDRTLVYALGGYAMTSGQAFVDNTAGGQGGGRAFTGVFDSGWTVGAGAEYLINPSFSVKAEYKHFDFGTENAVLNGTSRNFSFSNAVTADSVTIGVNFLFGKGDVSPLK